jgi:hypothetical protein
VPCRVCRSSHGLTEFNIAGTSIEGTIPESIKHLRFLQRFDMQNTRMSCCNGSSSSGSSSSTGTGTGSCANAADQACLPSFLAFDENSSVPPSLNPDSTGNGGGHFMK